MPGDALLRQLRDSSVFADAPLSPLRKYGPAKPDPYNGRQKPYFESETDQFIWQNAKYSANYYGAKIQGVIGKPFDEIRGVRIRTMDIVEQSTGAQLPNDWQGVRFQDARIRGLHTGAKLWFGGNTWLATAPGNITSGSGYAVIHKCNAFWNHLDYYGNVKSEPFVWVKGPANSTANEFLDYSSIAHYYNKCMIQLNDDTRELLQNRRMVLGHAAFQMTALIDFSADFSEVYPDQTGAYKDPENQESHILYFDLYFTEPLETDDMERHIAGAGNFSWKLLTGIGEYMRVGGTQNITVKSIRNNEEISSTAAFPIGYVYSTTDTEKAIIDENGTLQALSAGTVTVRVALEQNPDIYSETEIIIAPAIAGLEIVPNTELPDSIRQMQTFETDIECYVNGSLAEGQRLDIVCEGANEDSYEAVLDGKTLRITCYEYSEKPLHIIIFANDAGGLYPHMELYPRQDLYPNGGVSGFREFDVRLVSY